MFKRIGVLYMFNNSITSLDDFCENFKQLLPTTERIDLSYNKIETIPPGCFSWYYNTENVIWNDLELNLYANPIKSIATDSLDGLTKVSFSVTNNSLINTNALAAVEVVEIDAKGAENVALFYSPEEASNKKWISRPGFDFLLFAVVVCMCGRDETVNWV